jgi:cold shock CspA family protein
MSWFLGSFADRLFGAARSIYERFLSPAKQARADWQQQYAMAETAIIAQVDYIDRKVQAHYRSLSLAEATALHSQSVQAADLAHDAFKLAHRVLDALGESIIETARQRKALEKRARTAHGTARMELQREIDSLHQLRDRYLVPDKDRVKAEKDRLLADVRRLNMKTAQLRDIKAGHYQALESSMTRATVKWFNSAKGYGFLVISGGREVYVNASAVPRGLVLREGMTVWCRIRKHADGRHSAVQVSL